MGGRTLKEARAYLLTLVGRVLLGLLKLRHHARHERGIVPRLHLHRDVACSFEGAFRPFPFLRGGLANLEAPVVHGLEQAGVVARDPLRIEEGLHQGRVLLGGIGRVVGRATGGGKACRSGRIKVNIGCSGLAPFIPPLRTQFLDGRRREQEFADLLPQVVNKGLVRGIGRRGDEDLVQFFRGDAGDDLGVAKGLDWRKENGGWVDRGGY